MKVGVLFSGGKDSTYAAFIAKQLNDELACLITLEPKRPDSYMFHHPAIRWTRLQAETMHVPQVCVKTEAVKELELDDMAKALRLAQHEYLIRAVYTGALASRYQKTRVERVCAEIGLDAISPLWHIDPMVHLANLLKNRFKVMMTGAAALGLDMSWLGRILDERAIYELGELGRKYGVNPGLEGGEGETFVLDCPLFDREIQIISAARRWSGDAGYLEINDARLVPK